MIFNCYINQLLPASATDLNKLVGIRSKTQLVLGDDKRRGMSLLFRVNFKLSE